MWGSLVSCGRLAIGLAAPGRIARPTTFRRTALLLLRRLGKVGKPEMPAEVGQRFQIDVAHQVADGELPGFAGQDRDAGYLALLTARPHFDVLVLAAALDAHNAAPLRRLELSSHFFEIGRSVAALLLEVEALDGDALDAHDQFFDLGLVGIPIGR